jgi:hypothetical protein
VRWFLATDHKVFSVDNAIASDMDYSDLDPTIWMVQWTDGKGEIEKQIDKNTNDNGLRETFIDVIPYVPYFQQFLERVKFLKLPQAKKVQIDLIHQIFDSKRQAPFHYPVAAGDYWWDATDATLFSSTAAGLQNTIATLNTLIDKVNALAASINSGDSSLIAQINARIVAPGDALTTAHNSTINTIASNIYQPLFYFVEHFNYLLESDRHWWRTSVGTHSRIATIREHSRWSWYCLGT